MSQQAFHLCLAFLAAAAAAALGFSAGLNHLPPAAPRYQCYQAGKHEENGGTTYLVVDLQTGELHNIINLYSSPRPQK